MDEFTVKAREHQGTSSLDLTIPTKLVKENKISSGDIFTVKVNKEGNSTKIEYTLVYKKK